MPIEFSPELDRRDWQYSTAYLDGRPVATVTRRRVYDRAAPNYSAHWCDGSEIATAPTARGIGRRIERAIAARGADKLPRNG